MWLLAIVACKPPQPAARPGTGSGSFVLAHTNDIHAHYEPNKASWLEGQPAIGGILAIDAEVRALRTARGDGDVLVLDGGDLLTGTPLMDFQVRGAYGGAMQELVEAVGYDALTLGNHEFDLGWENVSAFVAAAKTPVVSANLDGVAGGPLFPTLLDHVILDVAGLKVGVFGLITEELPTLASPAVMAHVALKDEVETARAEVQALEGEVDLVVALTHIGIENDERLAREVPGIDLIVGGHTHTPVQEPKREGDTWIVQAGSYARQLGIAEITVEQGAITTFAPTLADLRPETSRGPPGPELQALVARYDETIAVRFGEVVGHADEDLVRDSHHESSLGRWVADLVRTGADADVGFYNNGGIRADLYAGDVTRGALYQIFPFTNQLVRFTATGAELLTILENALAAELGQADGSLQMSGIVVRWSGASGAARVESAMVAGKPVDPARTYTVATNSYVAEQWLKYLGVEPAKVESTDRTILDVALDFATKGVIRSPTDVRAIRVDAG
jgi:5'-nucleotidase / UDP-sugar diphosphatase